MQPEHGLERLPHLLAVVLIHPPTPLSALPTWEVKAPEQTHCHDGKTLVCTSQTKPKMAGSGILGSIQVLAVPRKGQHHAGWSWSAPMRCATPAVQHPARPAIAVEKDAFVPCPGPPLVSSCPQSRPSNPSVSGTQDTDISHWRRLSR